MSFDMHQGLRGNCEEGLVSDQSEENRVYLGLECGHNPPPTLLAILLAVLVIVVIVVAIIIPGK